MEILNASDAKRKFGVVVSAAEYAQLEALKEEHLRKAIQEGIADLQAGKVTDSKTVIEKLRKRVSG